MEEKEIIGNENPSNVSKPNEELVANKNDEIDLDVRYVERPTNDSSDYGEKVEELRQGLFNRYKKTRRINNILMFAVLIVAAGSMFLVTRENQTLKIIGWALIGVTIVGLIVYWALTRNKFPEATQAYIDELSYLLNQRTYDDDRFEEVHYNKKEKLDLASIISDNVYANVGQISSRNVVRGKFEKHSFTCAELALYDFSDKRSKKPLFVGKYIVFQNDLHFENRYIFVSTAKDNVVDLPNATNDLETLFSDGNHIVYGPKDSKYEEVIGKNFINRFNQIEIKNSLMNLIVVVWAGHTAVYASYTDDVMALPFDRPFAKNAMEQCRGNIYEILSVLRKLQK